MKLKAYEDLFVIVVSLIFLVSSLSAISYYNANNVFYAKISDINNEKAPYSVFIDLESYVGKLNFEAEVIYKRGDLVVSSEMLKCDGVCRNQEILLKKIFFDKYEIHLVTKHDNRYYKKILEFQFEKAVPKFSVEMSDAYLWQGGNLVLTGDIISSETDKRKYIFDVFPTKQPDRKETYDWTCKGSCRFDLEIRQNIFFGEYTINAYSQYDVAKDTFQVTNEINKFMQFSLDNNSSEGLVNHSNLNLSENNSFNNLTTESLDSIFNYSKLEFDEETTSNFCVLDEDLNLKKVKKKGLNYTCNFNHSLNLIDENFKIQNLPKNVFLGEEFEFEILVPIGISINASNLELPRGFEIVGARDLTDLEADFEDNKGNKKTKNFKKNKKFNTYLVLGKIENLDQDLEVLENVGWLRKKIDVDVGKSKTLEVLENNLNVEVEGYLKNNSKGKSDIFIKKNTSKIKFENVGLEDVKKVEVVKKMDLKNYDSKVRNYLTTDIIYVEASNFSSAELFLEKFNSLETERILTCDIFEGNGCISGWKDLDVLFNQNETHVWFNVNHFSAYSAVGGGYVFDVDFRDYTVDKIDVNDTSNINVTVACDNTGDCGTINVTLHKDKTYVEDLEDFETNFGDWSSDAGSCYWRRNNDNTPSQQTGPGGNGNGFDHTLGDTTGFYIYVETSSNACQGGDTQAVLTGTSFYVGSILANLTFWYHMAADTQPTNMGDLHVDIYNGSTWITDVWSRLGRQQTDDNDPYLFANIDLSSYVGTTINTRFRVDSVSGWQSDVTLDDIKVISWGEQMTNSSIVPFKIDGSYLKQISINQLESKDVQFVVNASGEEGNVSDIYAIGVSSTDATVKSQSLKKTLVIPESTPPSGNKVFPSNGTTSTVKDVTFNATVTDNAALSKATLYVWDSNDNLVTTETVTVLGTAANVSIDYSFFTNGNFTWNILVTDYSDNTYWLDSGVNWDLVLDFPGVGLEFLNVPDKFAVIKDTTKNMSINVSCNGANCGQTNVSLYSYQKSSPTLTLADFESGFGDWTSDSGSCFWSRNSDNTPSANTGPGGNGNGFDHTIGDTTGFYVYTETSSSVCQGSDTQATLTGTELTTGVIESISFWYHMAADTQSANMGDLHLDYYNGTTWTNDVWNRSGVQQLNVNDAYLEANVDLSLYTNVVNLRFRVDSVGGWQSDVTLDDIDVSVKEYFEIGNSSTTPFYIMGDSYQQATLNDGDSSLMSFIFNATGEFGETYLIVARGLTSNTSLDGQSAQKNLTIVSNFDLNVTLINLTELVQDAGNSTLITCYVQNNYTAEGIDNYEVSFSGNVSGSIGTADTNSEGYVTYNYTIPKTPTANNLTENITCLIGNDVTRKYYATDWNNQSIALNVTESAPWYTSWSITGGTGHDRNRSDIVSVSSQWYDNFMLNYSNLEHNGTGSFVNYSMSMNGVDLLQTYNLDLTNGTIFPNVGFISFEKMYVFDYFNWSTNTSPALDLTLYGFADISKILPSPAAVGEWGQNSLVYCEVKDNFTGIAIENYNVSFTTNISGSIGSNLTDLDGKAYITVNITEPINISCDISDELGLYYYRSINTQSTVLTRDQIPPTWSNWGFKYGGGSDIANGTYINKTQSVYVHSYWQDNYQLYYAYLNHNGTGSFENHSIISFPTVLDSNESWANHTLDFTNNSEFSRVGLIYINTTYGSDKADNTNYTFNPFYFYLYGFANLTSMSISDYEYGSGNNSVQINCSLVDNVSGAPIYNYVVNISSNETGLISSTTTNIQGIASTIYNDLTPEKETISCDIGPDTYYYVDVNSVSAQVYYDNTTPTILSNYSVTPDKVHPGESVELSVLWKESINSSLIYTDMAYFPITTYKNNWTNGTITTSLAWAKGAHDVGFVNTYDQNSNLNLSTGNLTLNMYHYANIDGMTMTPTEVWVDNLVSFACRVKNEDLGTYISGYNVSFYENGVYVNSSLTGSDGWASSEYTPTTTGVKTIKCDISIDDLNYYDPTFDAYDTKSLSVVSLAGRACNGDTLSVPYNNYFDSSLDDGFRLLEGSACSNGVNDNFGSWLTKVTQRADSYGSYSSGPTESRVIHSNQILDAGDEMRLECDDPNTPEESYTHLYENKDPASMIGLKILVYYTNYNNNAGLDLDSSPNRAVLFSYGSDQDTVNSTSYVNTTFIPTTSTCTGENEDGLGAIALYQELDAYSLIQTMIDEGLSTIDMRLALYTHSNYDGGNDLSRWFYNEIELYTKQLFVTMQTPVSTINTYANKTESLTCLVSTSGTNTSNVDLYPQFCHGASCTNFTNIQGGIGALRVNDTNYACSDGSCTKTFYFNYTEEGIYNIRCNSTNFNTYSATSTSQNFVVHKANMSLINFDYSLKNLDEFEVGDSIAHINVTVFNDDSGYAYDANATLNILNSSGEKPSWFLNLPDTKYCSNPVLYNSTCNNEFDNSGLEYSTSSGVEGVYNFTTNFSWVNKGSLFVNNLTFTLWNLRNRFSSSSARDELKYGQRTIIRFNMTNPSSNYNLTDIDITINCPVGFTCEGNNGYVNSYTNISPGVTISSSFNVTAEDGIEFKNYDFSFDVDYINYRVNSKSWTDIESLTISVGPWPKYKLTKFITNLSQNKYLVSLNISNLVNLTQNLIVLDFVDNLSTASEFSQTSNFTDSVMGGQFTGEIYAWNLTLINVTSINLLYNLTLDSNASRLLDAYMLGVD